MSAGADILDTGEDGGLAVAVRRALPGVRLCGPAENADYTRDPSIAARGGAILVCDAPIPAERVLVSIVPAEVEAHTRAGWPVLVDVDGDGDTAVALAALCAWLGAAVIRSRHVREVRRSLDMTASVMGTRPPAWAVRGLA